MSSEHRHSAAQDLTADTAGWSTATPRVEIEPKFTVVPHGGPEQSPALVVAANGDPLACGCWRRSLEHVKSGRRYRIEVAFQAQDIEEPGHHVWAMLTHEQNGRERHYAHLEHVGHRGGWERFARTFEPASNIEGMALCLYLAWTAQGEVVWADAWLTDITDEPAEVPRLARLAAVSGNPDRPSCLTDCLDFYCEKIDEVGKRGVDLVCLPEIINAAGLSGSPADRAETIPGPSYERLADSARAHRTHVAASLYERDGDAIYNTGLLIDRAGGIVGKYRKTHLPFGEGFPDGVAPGHDYPVFDTDLGRVGIMICYDTHFPEVARILSLRGAEIILNSNMGDGREGGILWEPVIRTRAIDNQVHVVAAINGGRSCIISPLGEVLAMTDRTRGSIAYATCDIGVTLRDSTTRVIRRRYDRGRRTDTYGVLTEHVWESVRNP